MPVFGAKSKEHLARCHPQLQKVLKAAILKVDFSIIESTRNKKDQDYAYSHGFSKVKFPNSAHNQTPSVAIDFIPYPFKNWQDTASFKKVGKIIVATGKELKIPVRWGGDFNMDGDKTTSDGWDLGHIELYPWRDFA